MAAARSSGAAPLLWGLVVALILSQVGGPPWVAAWGVVWGVFLHSNTTSS